MTPEEWETRLAAAHRSLHSRYPLRAEEFGEVLDKVVLDLEEHPEKTDEEIGDEIIKSLKRALEEEAFEE